jgi:hypothetical protein
MSQDRPHIGEALRTVRELLDRIGPTLEAGPRYDLRVASYLLEMAEREVELGDGVARRDQASLTALLGHDGTLEELERELAARLRRGELDDRLEEVTLAVLERVVDKVRIVRPSQLDPIHHS